MSFWPVPSFDRDPFAYAPRWAKVINDKLDLILTNQRRTETSIMALKATDQALISEVHRNTDVAKAAVQGYTALNATVADLTKKLEEAVANSDASDDADVQAAISELKKNNDEVTAAIPALATATANTNPAAPVPTP